MHQSSYNKMADFVTNYLSLSQETQRRVLDFGSMDINGTYRSLFKEENWHYTGIDMKAGTNVDVVVKDKHSWKEIDDSSIDVVISGQALEHVEFPWLIFESIHRILKSGGLCCIIAPSSGPEHRYPVDCWRIYPDGMRALCKHANLQCIEVLTDWGGQGWDDGSWMWKDTRLIAKK